MPRELAFESFLTFGSECFARSCRLFLAIVGTTLDLMGDFRKLFFRSAVGGVDGDAADRLGESARILRSGAYLAFRRRRNLLREVCMLGSSGETIR